MRPHREPGIRRDARGRIQAYVRAGGQLRFKRFPVDTSLETVRRWRLDTRVGLRLTQRAPGTLAADIEPFLRQIADRPKLVAERRQQLEWWAGAPRPAPSSRHHPGRGIVRLIRLDPKNLQSRTIRLQVDATRPGRRLGLV